MNSIKTKFMIAKIQHSLEKLKYNIYKQFYYKFMKKWIKLSLQYQIS